MTTLLQDTIDFDAPPDAGDAAVLHRAQVFFLRQWLGATKLPVAPSLAEQRKMLPLLEGFAKAMIVCAAGDGKLAAEELDWVLGFVASAGGTEELLNDLATLDPGDLEPMKLLEQTERPAQFIHSLVYHAIKAADADGVLDPAEVYMIRGMAVFLGVPESDLDKLFELHREEKEFLGRKMALLFPNGHPWG